MKLEEFKSGLRVYIEWKGVNVHVTKVYGMCGTMTDNKGKVDIIVKFDGGQIAKVNAENAYHFHLEPTN
jgi:hypothetical protein